MKRTHSPVAAFAAEEAGSVKWFAQMLPVDSSSSSHPVERAVALGRVLESRNEVVEAGRVWQRVRTVQTAVQSRIVRVVERWEMTEQGSLRCAGRDMFLADQLIVAQAPGADRASVERLLATGGMQTGESISEGLFTVRLSSSGLDAVPQALRFLSAHPDLVTAAGPDGVGFGAGLPNDASFGSQWGHHNAGQSGGTVDADVDAPEFWDIIESAPGLVVAVLDSGLNTSHPDLLNLSWVNPGEVPGDGIDNDGSGKVDDTGGWDFVSNDKNPADDHGHGSNVTGIMAATRNNAAGIAGMIGVRVLVCKILNSANSGFTSHLIAAVTYARQRGVPVMNLSLQNYPLDIFLYQEFTACEDAGILLSVCAGNQGFNNDEIPNYPSCYPHSNLIAVGSHDRTDARWSGTSFNPSNYGATSVDLFAPGRDILSPILGTSYSSYTGTSQATPYVTAVCAAIKYANPSWTASSIKASVLASVVTRPAYAGQCSTGGRLNAANAISHAIRQLPDRDSDGDGHANLLEYLAGTKVDARTSRPAVFHQTAGGYLKTGMTRVIRPDARLEVETSRDLQTWTPGGVTDFSTGGQLLGGIPISGDGPRFLRIRGVASP
ncbi:S8 family serine peptidase [Luteolibacter arcticus]|uniref:S8 family serine peptidase n=1 Tax=Luteolibacter arcticus TaxID=1581411 RepID=A0ABT3GCE6_9BACT|nr:S8 family serine peptidase [Luteolibacter arcticus]MCW1921088.1 S8 family serine peptidase [Luteolibacter arcticus]